MTALIGLGTPAVVPSAVAPTCDACQVEPRRWHVESNDIWIGLQCLDAAMDALDTEYEGASLVDWSEAHRVFRHDKGAVVGCPWCGGRFGL